MSQIGNAQNKGEWVEVEITSDSGACETVMPQDMCENVSITPSLQSERGDEYEVANGDTVPNVGEKKCIAMTQGSRLAKNITFQCADVHKPLLSTACAADAGYDSYYGKVGGYMEHRETKERIPMHRRDNLYFIKMWIKPNAEQAGPFGGQGR